MSELGRERDRGSEIGERSEREKGWPVAVAAASMFLELGKDL